MFSQSTILRRLTTENENFHLMKIVLSTSQLTSHKTVISGHPFSICHNIILIKMNYQRQCLYKSYHKLLVSLFFFEKEDVVSDEFNFTHSDCGSSVGRCSISPQRNASFLSVVSCTFFFFFFTILFVVFALQHSTKCNKLSWCFF